MIEEDEDEEPTVDMADRYQQTGMSKETAQQLQDMWQRLREREERREEPRTHTAAYATNIFWQVYAAMFNFTVEPG